ncbi:TerB family tellurite resistance protein [Streptomyces sp. NPDC050355]|uniref:TerB family tellurite resistance protein n=1 Tax=Streptomyces sp. NPDC050355 TaxID=3365609 RepID=UPI0037B405B5
MSTLQGDHRLGARVWGVRTTWRTVGDGDFFCPGCGGDRSYLRRTGRLRLAFLGIPLTSAHAGPVVECADCGTRFGTDVLNHPTSTRFSAMLRDAVHTVALAVLAAGGFEDRAVRAAAVGAVHGAGFVGCTEEQLVDLLNARAVATGRPRSGHLDGTDGGGAALTVEVHEALDPIAPHLARVGSQGLLLQGARIALADGPYSPGEHRALAAVGRALLLSRADTERLLTAAARTPT